ncbi:hypothetical protein Y032_0040g250 [Ancylostoma ceylanicum]|uniref:Uncharacterized protein n=1 Tax=Ancylostoma ceylanicum TaxID=53326 RepID=A0A016UI62_9BILA|nr:hypothetical protein Y032_0040g250 [Ancylostoma ceylanicum]
MKMVYIMDRDQVEIDRIKITCSGTSGFAYPRICFYWIADSRNHCNMSARACLSDRIKYIGYGPWSIPHSFRESNEFSWKGTLGPIRIHRLRVKRLQGSSP